MVNLNGTALVYMKQACTKTRLKWPKSQGNHKAQFPKLNVFVGENSTLRRYYIQNVKERIQILLCKITKERETQVIKFISVEIKKIEKASSPIEEKEKKIEALEN